MTTSPGCNCLDTPDAREGNVIEMTFIPFAVANALYNIIDRMYIGNSPDLGPLGIAGITIGFPLTLVMMALAMLCGIGGASMFSIHLGEKRPEEAEKYLGNAVTMLIIFSSIFTIIGLLFLQPLLYLFGASPDVMPYAEEYMGIVLWGSIFQGLSMGLNNFIRADGSPKIAMVTMFLGAGFNIVFDPIFIYVFRWGMTGAALATVGGQLLTVIWTVSYFSGKRCSHRIRPSHMKPERHLIYKIITTGTPSFLTQIGNSVMNIILNKGLIIYGGDIAVSGIGVINSIWFLSLPLVGFQIVSASYFQAVGKARAAAFLSSTRQLIILIPAALILPRLLGLNGILYAAPLADFLSSVITGIWLWTELKHLNLQIVDKIKT